MDINKLVSDELAKQHQINSFTKGMNSDTSYDLLDSALYIFGKNIRVTNNVLLGGTLSSNNTELVIAPVCEGSAVTVNRYKLVSSVVESNTVYSWGNDSDAVESILAVGAIENAGCVIVKLKFVEGNVTTYKWSLYKAVLTGDVLDLYRLYISTDAPPSERFDIVLINETKDVSKVYIATGGNMPTLCVFLDNDDIKGSNSDGALELAKYYKDVEEDKLASNAYFPHVKPRIRKASGSMTTSQVQYCYRYYRRYGYTSKLSPLTNKILIIGSSRLTEHGNAEDTTTDMGIDVFVTPTAEELNMFNKLLVFRISYIKYRQLPEVHLIYDETMPKTVNELSTYQLCLTSVDESNNPVIELADTKSILVHDSGTTKLAQYSIDEFSALSGQTIYPKVIESSQGYLFSGNCTDATMLDNAEVSQASVLAKTIYAFLTINDVESGEFNNVPKESSDAVHVTAADDKIRTDPAVSGWPQMSIGEYLLDLGIEPKNADTSFLKARYSEPFVSSTLRSLKRGEYYRYGVVFYDKNGRRSNVQHITAYGSLNELSSLSAGFGKNGADLRAQIGGIGFLVTRPSANIVGFEIVRQEKTFDNTEHLLQVAISRPLRLGKYQSSGYRTPYYPNVFLSSLFFYVENANACYYNVGWTTEKWDQIDNASDTEHDYWTNYFDYCATNVENHTLYQIFAPKINVLRNDVLSELQQSDTKLKAVCFYSDSRTEPSKSMSFLSIEHVVENPDANHTSSLETLDQSAHTIADGVLIIKKHWMLPKDEGKDCSYTVDLSEKISRSTSFVLTDSSVAVASQVGITGISDVKNPNWENGFSQVTPDINDSRSRVSKAIQQYKAYTTTVNGIQYNNWASNGMYNMATTYSDAVSQLGNVDFDSKRRAYVFHSKTGHGEWPTSSHRGWIGPGPVCLLLNTENPSTTETDNAFRKQFSVVGDTHGYCVGTLVCNITHTPVAYQKLDPYYGFGNYFSFDGVSVGGTKTAYVFDGDVYLDLAEFTNLFKAYDFNDQRYTLQSGQIVYYIPLESEINVLFDYGANYRNTGSANLMLEPGQITGVATLSRPLHQYNRIYSDNNWSINTFYESSDAASNVFETRIYYSLLKTNGEGVDNWQIIKPADFIDADSKYGQVTNLLAVDNTLYYWQTGAFGKLSVNERSLVTDDKGETIQLGQGGVLNRTDYISTQYGMRERDFSAISTEDALYWIDIQNKAILMCKQNQAVNYGEALNVQNLINSSITNDVPYIHYDLQNNELLCKCLSNSEQLVFNTKYGVATSVYNRTYDDAIVFNNVIVSLTKSMTAKRINYLATSDNHTFLHPTVIEFVVNAYPQLTKVYDNQKVVILKKDRTSSTNPLLPAYLEKEHSPFIDGYMTNRTYKFETDLHSITDRNPEAITDREGNICYSFPRTTSENKERNSSTYDNRYSYGGRMRGKWMKETITNNSPSKDYCISMIITKFRQSYN